MVARRDNRDIGAAAGVLRQLLMENPRYRALWEIRAKRARGELNQAAIAEAIALDLWDRGERPETEIGLARELKDRVSRALSGSALSTETLNWFISAFGIEEADEARLWGAYSGRPSDRVGISNSIRERRELLRRQRHRTVCLFERYFVDRSGCLVSRKTFQVIRAADDGLESYIYSHEADVAEVVVLHGGEMGERYSYGGGLFATEVILEQILNRGDAIALEYHTRYVDGNSPNEVRRASFAKAENVDIAVEFAQKNPARAWWCVWEDHLLGAPIGQESVRVKGLSIHRYASFVEQAVVGFRWEW